MGTLTLDEHVALDVAALDAAATQAGFGPDWVEVEATGTVSSTGAEETPLQLAVPGQPETMLIAPVPGQDGARAFDRLVREAARSGVTIRITGRAGSTNGGRVLIRLDSFQVLEAEGR